MKSTLNFFLLYLFIHSTALFSQESLVLTRDKKTVRIDKNDEAYFYETIKLENGDSIEIYHEGKIYKISSDSISLSPIHTEKNIYYSDGRMIEYNTFYSNDTISKINLKKSDIKKIYMGRPIAYGLLYTGVVAAFSAIAVAPLASINFKKGTFNNDRYAAIAGISTGVFIPCMVIGIKLNFKKYNLKSGKNTWKIE